MYRMFKEVLIFFENEFKNRGKSYLLREVTLFQAFWLSVFFFIINLILLFVTYRQQYPYYFFLYSDCIKLLWL